MVLRRRRPPALGLDARWPGFGVGDV